MIDEYVSAGEMKRLLSSLLAVLGLLVIAALFASIVVPGLRSSNIPQVTASSGPAVGESGWLDPTEFPPMRGRVIPPIDPTTLLVPAPQLLSRGKDLFEKNCTACHGETGHGDGPAASTMNPRPRDFTQRDSWTNGYDLPAIYRTLGTGVNGTSMTAFDYLSKSDRMALAHYVQTLGRFPHGSGSEEAKEDLERQLLTPGERTPNRIPVSMALARLTEEFGSPPNIEIPPEDHSPGAEILRRVVNDPAKAAMTLAGMGSGTGGDLLAVAIVAGAPGNGFSVSVATLSAEEWQALLPRMDKIRPH